jgi:hypothetical protein
MSRKTHTAPVVTSPAHSLLAPSAAERWTVCTASVGFIEANADVLPKESTVYADEGTKAHALAADILNGKSRLVQSDNADEIGGVRAYVDFVREQIQAGDRHLLERRTPLFYFPQQHGTVDFGLIGKKRISVIDLKFGVGVSVYAKENKQLAIYAESLIQEMELLEDITDTVPVEMNIFQPRDRNDEEPVRSWVITRGELRSFTQPIESTARLILKDPHSPDLKFVPTEKGCRFCPAKGICKAYGTQGLSVISDEPVDVVLAQPTLTLPTPNAMTREQRLKVVAVRSMFEKWLEAVEDQEVSELLAGAAPITHKLVEGKSNRKWKDEKAALDLLTRVVPEDEAAPRSIISPAQAEKLMKAHKADKVMELLKSVTMKPEGKPSLVGIDDPRPALVPTSPKSQFEDLEDVI